jgi:cysteinyl-tRNA synthetase
MSEAVLGLPIDIHGGGHDLIFPHHTNEIAQSCAAHHTDDLRAYARYWMHNGFLDMSGEKMSKSLGNVVLVHDLVKTWPGEVIRWALLSGHYRSPLDWTPELLERSRKNLDYIYGVLLRAENIKPIQLEDYSPPNEALCDDLNTPNALSRLMATAGNLERFMRETKEGPLRDTALGVEKDNLLKQASLLGFLQGDPNHWFSGAASDDFKAVVEALIDERHAARQTKNWAEADRIRAQLTALNVVVMDNPTGATWRVKD